MAPPITNRPLRPEVLEAYQQHLHKEAARRSLFGETRPIITTQFQGHNFVVVGNEIHWGKWKTFTDFLVDHLKGALGGDWGNAELAKPLERRHVILQWHAAFATMQARFTPGPDGITSGEPDGPSFAFLSLAYDLYVLKDHVRLRNRLLHRLRDPEDFQGTRYEVYVAAALIRGGFSVEPVDESDGSVRHVDFIATHKATAAQIAVEAKSRRLPGVLGRDGVPPDDGAFRLDIRGLIADAIEKPAALPYAVFVEANMPPAYAVREKERWYQDAAGALKLAEAKANPDGTSSDRRIGLLVVTNVPLHYGEPGQEVPPNEFLILKPDTCARPVDAVLIEAIHRGTHVSHRIPQQELPVVSDSVVP